MYDLALTLHDLSLFPICPSFLFHYDRTSHVRPVPLSYFSPSFLFQEEQENLESLTKKHAALGLTRRHYEIFADTLVKTIGEFGQDDPDELNAWRYALEPAIAFIWKCQEEARAHDVDV